MSSHGNLEDDPKVNLSLISGLALVIAYSEISKPNNSQSGNNFLESKQNPLPQPISEFLNQNLIDKN